MEQAWTYGGFSIVYSGIGGITRVLDCGFQLAIFRGKGYIKGKRLAEDFIDNY